MRRRGEAVSRRSRGGFGAHVIGDAGDTSGFARTFQRVKRVRVAESARRCARPFVLKSLFEDDMSLHPARKATLHVDWLDDPETTRESRVVEKLARPAAPGSNEPRKFDFALACSAGDSSGVYNSPYKPLTCPSSDITSVPSAFELLGCLRPIQYSVEK